jgi:hypothetical protein
VSETATVLVKSVELKEGVSQSGKPYKRVVLTDGNGNFASSFDPSLFEKAKPFEGQQAEIFTQPNGKFTDLIDIKAAPSEPKPGDGSYVTGRKPPIEARRIYASTAWNCAARMAGPDLGFEAAQNIANKIFHDLLIKGKAIEDEDIPF